MLSRHRILGLLLVGPWLAPGVGATEPQPREIPPQPLFDTHTALEVTLVADWPGLWRSRQEVDRIWEGELRYKEEGHDERVLPVGFSPRGLSRLNPDICDFANLFLHFEPAQVQGTLFATQQSLPLVTYCQRHSVYQQYVIKEYLLYRVYNLLTDLSLRVRLVRVTYEPTGRGRISTGHAFFVENYHALAHRLGGRVVEIEGFNPNHSDPYQIGLLEVFQYLIGNTDWTAVHQHNIALIRRHDDSIIPIPFDLDHSGAVNAEYSVPDALLDIPTVRTRVFRGICRPEHHLTPVLDRFRTQRPAIEGLYREEQTLSPRELSRALKYYADFYRTLDSEKLLRSRILDRCRPIRPKK
jgi:hypothetical protein